MLSKLRRRTPLPDVRHPALAAALQAATDGSSVARGRGAVAMASGPASDASPDAGPIADELLDSLGAGASPKLAAALRGGSSE